MYEIILKLHPRKINSTKISQSIKKCINNGVKVKRDAVSNYYDSADIVIVGGSTIGIEFSYLNKNVINFSSRFVNRYSPPWMGESYTIKNTQELIDNILQFKKDKIPYNYYIGEPGSSKEKILNMLN